MIPSTNEPEATDTPKESICATLCLPKIKSSRSFRVLGSDGKPYEFRWHAGHQMLVREYTSVEAFHREEFDLRKNQRHGMVIITRLGATHPVTLAQESVRGLIAAVRSVPLDARREALEAIIQEAGDAILAMNGGGSPEVSPAITAEAKTPRQAVALPARWQTEDGQRIPAHSPPEGSLVASLAEGAAYHTQEELMKADMPSLRELAKSLGVSTTSEKGGQLGRAALVAEILDKQSVPQP